MSPNVEAVLILLWIVLAVTAGGLAASWLWLFRLERDHAKRMDRLRR